MIPTVNDFVNRHRWIRRRFMPFVVLGILIIPIFVSSFDHNYQMASFLTLIAIILIFIWDLLAVQLDASSIQFFSDAQLAHRVLEDIAQQNTKPTHAYAIHYSGQNLHDTLLMLQRISSVTKIHVFLQNPDKGISQQQIVKIKGQVDQISLQWDIDNKVGVEYYSEPASIRGILLEDVALCIGWYVYEDVPNPSKSIQGQPETLIWGHNTGAILVRNDSEGFAPLRDFFMRTVGYLQDTAVPLPTLRRQP